MSTTFERDPEGNVPINDGSISMQVPKNQTALSILTSPNTFFDGDRVEPPWVYHTDGTRSVLYTDIQGFRVKETRLYDPEATERLRHKIALRYEKMLERWAAACTVLSNAPRSRAHYKLPDGRRWCVYHHSSYGISTDYLKHKPRKLINTEVGEVVGKAMAASDVWGRIIYVADEILDKAIRNCTNKELWYVDPIRTHTKALAFVINGHRYIYMYNINRHGVSCLEKLAFGGSGDAYKEVVL